MPARGLLIVAFTTLLAACDLIFPGLGDKLPRVDVYADHFEFRFGRYETTSALAIAIAAAQEEPGTIRLRDCSARDELAAVIEMIRSRGNYQVGIVIPDQC